MSKVYIPAPASIWRADPVGTAILKASAFATCFALVAAFLSVLGD